MIADLKKYRKRCNNLTRPHWQLDKHRACERSHRESALLKQSTMVARFAISRYHHIDKHSKQMYCMLSLCPLRLVRARAQAKYCCKKGSSVRVILLPWLLSRSEIVSPSSDISSDHDDL